jgi:hypothetical protein
VLIKILSDTFAMGKEDAMKSKLVYVVVMLAFGLVWSMNLGCGCEPEKKTHQHVEVHDQPMGEEMVVE